MAIALHSGIAAADSFLAGSAAADYHMRLRRRLACQFAVAGGLHRLASTGPGRTGLVAVPRHWPLPMRWAARLTRPSGSPLHGAPGDSTSRSSAPVIVHSGAPSPDKPATTA